MGAGKIEYNIRNDYTILDLSDVRSTADTTKRPNALLPRPASSSGVDATTIYLDPISGNDANTGFTSALAKKTLQGADLAVTAIRNCIHIVSNDIDIIWSEVFPAGIFTFNANLLIIQVQEGKRSELTIQSNTGNGVTLNMPLTGSHWHALDVVYTESKTAPVAQSFLAIGGAGTFGYVSDSRFDCLGSCFYNGFINAQVVKCSFVMREARGGNTNYDIGYIHARLNAAASATIIRNSVFASRNRLGTGLMIGMDLQGFTTLNLQRLTLMDLEYGIRNRSNSYVGPGSDLTSNIFHRVGQAVKSNAPTPTTRLSNMTYSVMNVGTLGQLDMAAEPAGQNVYNVEPFFLAELADDWRLAHVGRLASTNPDIYYPITSPAFDRASTPLLSAGALQMTATPLGEVKDQYEFIDYDAFESVQLSFSRANYQEFQSITGRVFEAHDRPIRTITFQYPANHFTGYKKSLEFNRLLSASGFKRFYPSGDAGFITGTCSITSPTTLVVTSSPIDMAVDSVQDWVLKLDFTDFFAVAHTGYYTITSNTNGSFEVELLRGEDFNDFSLPLLQVNSFKVLYLPVIIGMETAEHIAQIYSEQGDPDNKPWYKNPDFDEFSDSEFHLITFVLKQTREPRQT